MQTFLPYPDFTESAKVLDRLRLGKQRVECKQILMTLNWESTGWKHHPAVRMWKGHEAALAKYALAMCYEWAWRGYRDSLAEWFVSRLEEGILPFCTHELPKWLGDDYIHSSHRAVLLYKDPEHYGQFGWTEEPQRSVKWPVELKNKMKS
jgi:hypothetical protein